VLLLGFTGQQQCAEWFGIVINGPVINKCGSQLQSGDRSTVLRRGGPIGSLGELWAVRSSSPSAQMCERRSGSDAAYKEGTVVGPVHVGDDWEAWLDASATGPSGTRFFRGECGWAPFQLEDEVRSGDWRVIVCPGELLLESFVAEDLYSSLNTAVGRPRLYLSSE